jgi:hypothetical protein
MGDILSLEMAAEISRGLRQGDLAVQGRIFRVLQRESRRCWREYSQWRYDNLKRFQKHTQRARSQSPKG